MEIKDKKEGKNVNDLIISKKKIETTKINKFYTKMIQVPNRSIELSSKGKRQLSTVIRKNPKMKTTS